MSRVPEPDRELLQLRLRTLARVLLLLSSCGFCAHLILAVATPFGFTRIVPVSGTNVALALGLLIYLRRAPRTVRALRAVEVLFMLATTFLVSIMVRTVTATLLRSEVVMAVQLEPHREALANAAMLGLSFAFVMRSAFVPSPPRYTAALTAAAGPMLLASLAFLWPPLPGDALIREASASSESFQVALTIVIWWTLATLTCTVTCRVVHGLRLEVTEARHLGQYVIESKIGEGGMGAVYRAKHAMMKRPTAVKLLPPERSSEAHLARFEREVQQTARLSHPNTIRIYDYGRTPEGVFYYAMELLDGATLDRIVELGGPMSESRVVHVLSGIAAALVEAHDQGLIHRDIKPSNIIMCLQGGTPDVPKLVDFGLVKEIDPGETDAGLTREGQVTGTPLYMPPEAIRAQGEVDERSDLYALGAVGYFALTGEHLFVRESVVEVCAAHLHETPEPPSTRRGEPITAELEGLVLACLEKDARARPQTAAAFLEALEALNIDRWSQADARRWWRDWGPELSERPGAPPSSVGPRTIVARLRAARTEVTRE